MSDPELTDCPACNKAELRRLVSAAGFQLKGNGWYQTDFRGGSKPAEKTSEGGGCGAPQCATACAGGGN
jgi:predicted nucleic acid-binding Zn ribbon protein